MSAFARLVLWMLKHAREPGHVLGDLEPWATVIEELLHAPNGQAAFEKLFRYILESIRRSPMASFRAWWPKRLGRTPRRPW